MRMGLSHFRHTSGTADLRCVTASLCCSTLYVGDDKLMALLNHACDIASSEEAQLAQPSRDQLDVILLQQQIDCCTVT